MEHFYNKTSKESQTQSKTHLISINYRFMQTNKLNNSSPTEQLAEQSSLLKNPSQFIQKLILTKHGKQKAVQESVFYNKLSQKQIQDFKLYFEVDLNSQMYGLLHGSVKCDIDQLLKYDWISLDRLYLNMSGISDDYWRKLVQHADRFANYINLFIISIDDNSITNIKKGDIQSFKSLQCIFISGNPLSQQSTKILQTLQKTHQINIK